MQAWAGAQEHVARESPASRPPVAVADRAQTVVAPEAGAVAPLAMQVARAYRAYRAEACRARRAVLGLAALQATAGRRPCPARATTPHHRRRRSRFRETSASTSRRRTS